MNSYRPWLSRFHLASRTPVLARDAQPLQRPTNLLIAVAEPGCQFSARLFRPFGLLKQAELNGYIPQFAIFGHTCSSCLETRRQLCELVIKLGIYREPGSASHISPCPYRPHWHVFHFFPRLFTGNPDATITPALQAIWVRASFRFRLQRVGRALPHNLLTAALDHRYTEVLFPPELILVEPADTAFEFLCIASGEQDV